MFSLSPMKLFIIVAVVVMLLGPDKLPDVAHRLGTWWHSLRRFQQRVENEVRATLPDLPSTSDIARIARNPVSVLNDLADRAERSGRSETDAEASSKDASAATSNEESPATSAPPTHVAPFSDPSLN